MKLNDLLEVLGRLPKDQLEKEVGVVVPEKECRYHHTIGECVMEIRGVEVVQTVFPNVRIILK